MLVEDWKPGFLRRTKSVAEEVLYSPMQMSAAVRRMRKMVGGQLRQSVAASWPVVVGSSSLCY